MKRSQIAVAVLATFALTGVAYASKDNKGGGEHENTHCQGRGNTNSPCNPTPRVPDAGPCVVGAGGPCNTGGTGVGVGVGVGIGVGQGGAGGNSNVDVRNTNTNTATGGSAAVIGSGNSNNDNRNTNTNTNSNANNNANTNLNSNSNFNSLNNTNTLSNDQSQTQAQTQSQQNTIRNSGNSESNSSVSNSGNSSSTATGGSVSNSGNSSATGGSATGGSVANSGNTAGNSSSAITINEASQPDKVTYKTVPNVGAPGLASAINNDLCVVSASMGGSGVGFGFAIGMQYRDEDCVRRVNARQLYNMGYAKASVLLMAQDPNVRKALEDAGEVLPPASVPKQPESQIGQFPSVVVR